MAGRPRITPGLRGGGVGGVAAHSSDTRATPKPAERPSRGLLSFGLHFLAGGVGGTVGAAVTCPLEVVKTRLQSSFHYQTYRNGVAVPPPVLTAFRQNPPRAAYDHMRHVVHILRDIRRSEGIRALWRGLGPTLIGVVPSRAIFFATYNQTKTVLTGWQSPPPTAAAEVDAAAAAAAAAEPYALTSPFVHIGAAGVAGVLTATSTNPVWLIKTRLQLQSSAPGAAASTPTVYANSWACLRTVLRDEGFRGLYRGLTASFLGIGENVIQFATYEYLKSRLRRHREHQQAQIDGKAGARRGVAAPPPPPSVARSQQLGDTVMTAGLSKLIAAGLTYPHEVLRTRLRQHPDASGHIKYRGVFQAAVLIYREEGLPGLYGGMAAHLMRVVPNAVILFLCYEGVVELYEAYAARCATKPSLDARR
ncbi:hypothetical protein CXG81DRAFT_29608 [Caulochytrium protostelioides]|uniref:Mitochondrial carrier n=1 Tax=Caulochytrium protostelioides TaxID=1555241 RepID=A0A4P9XAA3_9FUNG|nr:hypothetical protein CXG81DRAFT_29608 [Caulochytrium protostelioides]|eukprot:RKP02060.1 hypothetical protein CXG81DRAFT_29608 [Caulochytrium protostelioides]